MSIFKFYAFFFAQLFSVEFLSWLNVTYLSRFYFLQSKWLMFNIYISIVTLIFSQSNCILGCFKGTEKFLDEVAT